MYPRIAQRVFNENWLILPETHHAIQEALLAHIEGRHPGGIDSSARMAVPFTTKAVGNGLTKHPSPGNRVWTRGRLAVIPVWGVIGQHLSNLEASCGGFDVARLEHDISVVANDTAIRNVMFDFNTPGGTVTGVPEAGRMIAQLGKEKNTFGFTDSMSASAGYWLMSQTNAVYATESAGIGSIGVYAAFLDRTEAMKTRGEKMHIIKAGKHKAMGAPGNPLTDEDVAMIQAQVDRDYAAFTKAILSKRPDVKSETMQGQMFRTPEARAAKLVDATVTSLSALISKLG
jgi:signal peptide peptidase SppA